MVIWVAAILLIIAVALFIAAPLIDPVFGSRRSVISAESERREHEHGQAIQALRDLEFDHAMGKLDAGDYRALRERLEIRELTAMSGREKTPRYSSMDEIAPVVVSSQSVSAARTATVNFCARCGTRIVLAHNFCANCGAALRMTATAAN